LTIYVLYIEDDRYLVPTVDILTADSDSTAQALAIDRLANSPHYTSVEVWADDRYVFRQPNGKRSAPPAIAD
jgi:hypothetical protein